MEADSSKSSTVEIKCDACGGVGYGSMLYGYVTHDMAMDGGDMALEGEEIWGEAPCPVCGGGGIVGIICTECDGLGGTEFDCMYCIEGFEDETE